MFWSLSAARLVEVVDGGGAGLRAAFSCRASSCSESSQRRARLLQLRLERLDLRGPLALPRVLQIGAGLRQPPLRLVARGRSAALSSANSGSPFLTCAPRCTASFSSCPGERRGDIDEFTFDVTLHPVGRRLPARGEQGGRDDAARPPAPHGLRQRAVVRCVHRVKLRVRPCFQSAFAANVAGANRLQPARVASCMRA